ncbi:hypothetical protein [Hyalangium minutum]|uniref:Uncharacterized protein n=1 Tax=Hyalangium minutum TaxID=394096 RepID=A0A085WK16_9BACT|nr:hypothetical protein [Hyalangium minutum]KFE68029.1 hypothetical protein DB31_7266 [Hyalangium minutum]
MKLLQGIALVILGASCAHTPEKASPAESSPADRAQALSSQADKAYSAQDFSGCAELFRQAAEASTEDDPRATAFYSAAGCSALAGNPTQALELLRRSVQSGYFDPDTLQHDPELVSVHALPGWQEVVAGAQANLAKAPSPPLPVAKLAGIDVYGSRRASTEAVRQMLGFELGQLIVPSKALFKQKEEALQKQFNLAFAKIAFIYFFGGDDKGSAFITADLVDAEDAQRLRFLPEPTGHVPDPESLVAEWQAYDFQTERLMKTGQLDPEKGFTCRVAHCTFGFAHPTLERFEPLFLEKVPRHQDAITKVLREDADAAKREAAAYLLAYAASPEQTVARLVPSIRDPSGSVRNGVLRVLIATQEAADHPLVDAAVVADAASMPETTDRNKALFLLKMLLDDLKPDALKAQRGPLLKQLGPQLVTLAAMQQPINREPAIEVLQALSGESFETADQWKAWLARQPQ